MIFDVGCYNYNINKMIKTFNRFVKIIRLSIHIEMIRNRKGEILTVAFFDNLMYELWSSFFVIFQLLVGGIW